MHKKKILILFLLIFIICGCRANYDVKIIDNDISESFSFYEDNSINWDSVYSLYPSQSTNGTEYIPEQYTYRTLVTNQLNSFTQAFSNEGSKYITKSLINDNSKLGILYEYNYDVSNYSNAYIPSKAFKYFNFLSNDDRYVLSSSIGFKAFDDYKKLDSLTIELSTNHKVAKHNADEVNGYTYRWNIDRTNYSDKNVYVELYKDKYEKGYNNEKNKRQLAKVIKTILIVVLCIAISLFIVIIILRKKANRNNRI